MGFFKFVISKFFITPDQLYDFQSKWIALFFFYSFTMSMLTTFFFVPTKCTKHDSPACELGEAAIQNKCFASQTGAKSEILESYKMNHHVLFIFLFGCTLLFFLPKLIWNERKPRLNREFKIKNFILKSLISKENVDRFMSADKVNESLEDNKNMRSIFLSYVLTCYFYPILIFCILHFLLLDRKFISFGIEFFDDPFYQTSLFPKSFSCEFEGLNSTRTEICYLDCHLKFNNLYENIYITIWFIIILLFILITICLIGLVAIASSSLLRFRRLQGMVGKTIETDILLLIAKDVDTFFFLESISYRLDKADFQKLMLNLIKHYLSTSKKFCVVKCPLPT